MTFYNPDTGGFLPQIAANTVSLPPSIAIGGNVGEIAFCPLIAADYNALPLHSAAATAEVLRNPSGRNPAAAVEVAVR